MFMFVCVCVLYVYICIHIIIYICIYVCCVVCSSAPTQISSARETSRICGALPVSEPFKLQTVDVLFLRRSPDQRNELCVWLFDSSRRLLPWPYTYIDIDIDIDIDIYIYIYITPHWVVRAPAGPRRRGGRSGAPRRSTRAPGP